MDDRLIYLAMNAMRQTTALPTIRLQLNAKQKLVRRVRRLLYILRGKR